ncbi:MAG: SDR family NAD(P)-dependent oxidoreductase [Alphaproteobacteria bacterium]|nr:SDR family NAD(P)-dependent oxidoreductase [Alphaproteobacteria bacterium]
MKDEVVFVTGATSGFGQATARRFIRAGARVIATGRRGERLEELRDELGDRLHPLVLDMRDADALLAAATALPKGYSDVSILVNNAGGALGLDPAHEAKLDDWLAMIDTNVRGLAVLTRAILPGMVARRRGLIVNIGSVAAQYPYPGGNVYGATKAFVHQFSLNLRADLVDKNVRVTCIEPGMAETEFSLVRLRDQAKADAVYRGVKPMSAEDVAETIYWVATLPEHMNINLIEMMPTQQAFGPFAVHRIP